MRKRIITAFLAFIVFTTSSTSVAMATSSAGIRQIEGIPQLVTHLTHAMQELRLYASTVSGTPEAKMYELALVTNMYKYLYYIVSFDELSRDLYSIVPESIGISQAEIFLLVRDVGYIAESFVLTHNVSNLRLEYDDSMSANDRIADLRAQLSEKLGYIIPRIVVEDLEPLLFELEQNSNALSPQYTESILLRYREIAYWANEIANSLHEYREDFEILYALNAPRANDRDAVPGLADILLNTLIGQLNFPVDITDGLWGAISDHRGVSMITLEALREILSLASQAVLSPPGSDNAGVRIKQDIEYYIQALVNVQRNPGVEDNDFSLAAWDILGSNVQLSAAYTAMLASTAVYTPFRSKVGDEDYIQALRFLVEGTSVLF